LATQAGSCPRFRPRIPCPRVSGTQSRNLSVLRVFSCDCDTSKPSDVSTTSLNLNSTGTRDPPGSPAPAHAHGRDSHHRVAATEQAQPSTAVRAVLYSCPVHHHHPHRPPSHRMVRTTCNWRPRQCTSGPPGGVPTYQRVTTETRPSRRRDGCNQQTGVKPASKEHSGAGLVAVAGLASLAPSHLMPHRP
jgi:hypothetical protein